MDNKLPLLVLFVFFSASLAVILTAFNDSNDTFEAAGSYAGANVLLITLESVRQDHVGFYGYGRNTTPNIDRIAMDSFVFTKAYSQAGWTLPSITSIFTSLYPNQHNVVFFNSSLPKDAETIASVLNRNGYSTKAYATHVLLKNSRRLDKGFDDYDESILGIGHPREIHSSRELSDKLISAVEGSGKPFFVWAHYFDPHYWYLNHDGFYYGKTPLDRYDSEIAYMDYHLGRVFDFLEESGLMDDTIIILVADHGEEFQDHGSAHHRTLYEEIVKVPFIIYLPARGGNVIDDCAVQHIDVMPTILGLLQIDLESEYSGRNIFSDGMNCATPVFMERESVPDSPQKMKGIIYDDKKLIFTYSGEQIRKEFYDLSSDPSELESIYGVGSAEIELAESLLNGYILQNSSQPHDTVKLSDEAVKILRDMGYM